MPIGATLSGRYEILAHLGAGGMGTVYAARDRLMDVPVALKFVRRALARDAKEQARLREEVRLVQTITHPNVIRTFTLERHDDQMFIVMDLLRGQTLHERLCAGGLTVAEALAIVRGVLAGLAAAHARHIVHRDIKPQNIELCDDGRVVVMDFGIASARPPVAAFAAGSSDGLVLHGLAARTTAVGTPGYMAPEVLAGGTASVASDLYSVGVILDQMLPRYGDAGAPEQSARLDAIVARLLAESPAERFASAREVLVALDALAAGPSRRPRRRQLAGLALLLGLGVAAGAAWLLLPRHAAVAAPHGSPVPSPAAALAGKYETGDFWTSPTIHVCWENPSEADAGERAWVEHAVEQTWEAVSAIDFVGWGPCDGGGDGIRIRIVDDASRVVTSGQKLQGLESGMRLALAATAACPAGRSHQDCVMVDAVHEFGQALGLVAATSPASLRLSESERAAVQAVYGARPGAIVSPAGMCLESGAGGPGGSQVSLRECDGSPRQSWPPRSVTLDHVEIVGIGGRCMSAPGAEDGPVAMEDCTGAAWQRFLVGSDGTLRSQVDGRCVTSLGLEKRLVMQTCADGEHTQKWRFGAGGVINDLSLNLCADVWSSTQVFLRRCHRRTSERWRLRGELRSPAGGETGQRWTYHPDPPDDSSGQVTVPRTSPRFVANMDGDRFGVSREGRLQVRMNRGRWTDFGPPPGTTGPDAGIAPIQTDDGHKALFLIARGELFELRQSGERWAWVRHGRSPDCGALVGTPAVATDGEQQSAMLLCASGEVVERSSQNGWHWSRHGSPPGRQLSADKDLGYVMASGDALAMVVDSQGDVWELSRTAGADRWHWRFHGNPGTKINSSAALTRNPWMGYTGLFIGSDGRAYDLSRRPGKAWLWDDHGMPAEACRRGLAPGELPRYGSGFTIVTDTAGKVVFGVLRCRDEPTLVRDVRNIDENWSFVADTAPGFGPEGTPFAVRWASGGFGVLSAGTPGQRMEWDGFAPLAGWAPASGPELGGR